MYRVLPFGLALAVAIVAGITLGDATVAAMQVRSVADEKPVDDYSLSDRAYARGEHWAMIHGILDPDNCPEPDQDFRRGCVAGTGW